MWYSAGLYPWTPAISYIYINDLPKAINNRPIPILFIDDTSILFSRSNHDDFIENIHSLFEIE
jgi:hypothetical protein